VKALLDAAVAKDEVARALEAQDNPAILAMKAVSEGSEDVAQLRRWLARAVTAARADDVIDEA